MFLLSGVNPMTILWSTLVLLVLALVFGLVLAFCGKKLAVQEDERIGKVREKLSGANCGGCGYAGCPSVSLIMKIQPRLTFWGSELKIRYLLHCPQDY